MRRTTKEGKVGSRKQASVVSVLCFLRQEANLFVESVAVTDASDHSTTYRKHLDRFCRLNIHIVVKEESPWDTKQLPC